MKYSTIIIDWKQTLYDPDSDNLIDGAIELLELLQSLNSKLYLVGKGDVVMSKVVETLGVKKYFNDVLFVGNEKEPNHFNIFMKEDPKNTLIIGDKLSSEIELGNRLGATTYQVRQGKFAAEEPQNEFQKPNKVFKNLKELAEYFAS